MDWETIGAASCHSPNSAQRVMEKVKWNAKVEWESFPGTGYDAQLPGRVIVTSERFSLINTNSIIASNRGVPSP